MLKARRYRASGLVRRPVADVQKVRLSAASPCPKRAEWPRSFLLVGLPASGKTTLSKRLESDRSALVLSADEWMSRIVCDGWDAKRRAAVQEVQFEIGLKVLKLGGDVVLDFGLFHREERDRYRAAAVAVGAETKTVYLDVPKDELLRRLESRNAELPPHTFPVDEVHLDNCIRWFEPPTPDELN